MRRPRLPIVLSCIMGVVVFLSLVAWAGLDQIGSALDRIGWFGFAWICLLQLCVIGLCAAGWWSLTSRTSFGACLAARWVRDGATNLASLVPGFGEAVGVRILVLSGMSSLAAGACTLLDIGTETLAQALYAIIGLIPLSYYVGRDDMLHWAGLAVAGATPILMLCLAIRYRGALQLADRVGARLAGLFGGSDRFGSAGITQSLLEVYGQRRRVFAAFVLHLMAWFVGAVQVWAAAQQLERPLAFGAALAIDSLTYAARAALFIVPWGAGIQEGVMVLAGAAVGLDAASAIALSLVLRARDLVLGGPAILVWGILEWRHAARRTAVRSSQAICGEGDAGSPLEYAANEETRAFPDPVAMGTPRSGKPS
jgi:glycosyltransferase 2 family protein